MPATPNTDGRDFVRAPGGAPREKGPSARTKYLCVTRFDGTQSVSRPDSFTSLDHITQRFGTRFHFANIHEFFDCMEEATPEGNHTTPGRKTLNVDEGDLKRANEICDELIGGAERSVGMSRELMLPSVVAYVVTRKFMDRFDCNAFSIPCPDACSTKEAQRRQVHHVPDPRAQRRGRHSLRHASTICRRPSQSRR